MKTKNANPIIPKIIQTAIFPYIILYSYLTYAYSAFYYLQALRCYYKIILLIFQQRSQTCCYKNLLFHLNLYLSKFKKYYHSQMGQQTSTQADQNNKIVRLKLQTMNIQNLNNYQFITKKNDQSIVITDTSKNKYFLLRILTVAAQQDSISFTKILQKRDKIHCLHLCNIIKVKKQHQTLACSQIYKINLLIQCPSKSLQQQFQQRRQKSDQIRPKRFFHQTQLWSIVYSVVKALKSLYLYGIIHQSLSLDSIFLDQKGLVKLADPAVFGLEKNYIMAMKQKQNCTRILSPEILIFLDQYNFQFYQKEKSDIFILGIIVLQLSVLNHIPIYDYKQKRTRLQLIQSNLFSVKNRYSKNFCALIQWMTQIEPKKRPRLNELVDFIDKNNSQKSTNFTNTLYTKSQIPTVQVQNKFKRDKTGSAFSIDSKYQFQTPSIYTTQKIQQEIKNLQQKNQNSNIGQFNQRNDTEQSKNVFPFELVYNKIINNNDNVKKFQIENLYKEFKNTDMFGSSCRGSAPSSSYHAKIQESSKEITNKNLKQYDRMGFSKQSVQKTQNLMYSHSSAFNGSNKLSFSKNSLADIKLVQSSHIKQPFQYKKFIRNQDIRPSGFMQEIVQQASIQSPYRKLGSLRSAEGISFTSLRILDIEPIVFKQDHQFNNSNILQKYTEDRHANNFSCLDANLQSRYFSQQKQKQSKNQDHGNQLQPYKSQLLKKQITINLVDSKYPDIRLQQKYDRYLLVDRIINKDVSSKQIIDSSKNHSFQSSEMQSKISRATPNFAQRSKSGKRQTESQKQSEIKDQDSLNQPLFVDRQVSQQGDIYTGYKNKLGLKQRHGKLQFHDGGYYEGQWKDDQMQGYGEMYYATGSVAYKGLWKEGCFNGNGQIFNDTPEYFDTPFNFRDFTEIDDKWVSYQGEFENDSKHGNGKISLTNGQYFQGTFDYDMIDGHGVFHSLNGQTIKGLWKDNQLIEYN